MAVNGAGDDRMCEEYLCYVWYRDAFQYACIVGNIGP